MSTTTRSYVKSKRADNQAETSRRIAEATLDLHTEVGPARTTISMVAERAGVQRHTVYAHFPDDRSLFMACSGLAMERDPLPSPEDWAGVNDPALRLQQALSALYGWYSRNLRMMASVLRDAEFHELTREVTELRTGAEMRAIIESVSPGLGAKGLAALMLATSFQTWRTLTRDGGMDPAAAVEIMVHTVLAADG